METNLTNGTPTGLAVVLTLALAVASCGGGAETAATTDVTESGATADSTAEGGSGITTTADAAATGEPVASEQDPCTILTIDEINQVFPGNDEPLAAEGLQCLYNGFFLDLAPLTLEVIEAEEEPTGWEVRPLEIEGAEWAAVRIDTNVTDYEKVLDVIAGGPTGTVHLIVQNADVELGSATHEGVVGLLQTAVGRL